MYSASPIITGNTITGNWGGMCGGGIECALDADAVIESNVISDNNAYAPSFNALVGAGIYCNSASPDITSNTISHNPGGGICLYNSASPDIVDNTIEGNGREGGIWAYGFCDPLIARNDIAGNFGGGVTTAYYCFPTIVEDTVTGNTNTGGAGGIWCGDGGVIMDCDVSGNSGGGIQCGGPPLIANVNVSGNSAGDGGAGILCYGSPLIVNATVSGNSTGGTGGGVSCLVGSSAEIVNSTISSNTAGAGGGVYCDDASPFLVNNVIVGNTAESGGGLYCRYSSAPVLTNDTLTGNTATYGSGVYCFDSIMPNAPAITNCILWDGGDELYGCTATYSDVSTVVVGTGNISAEPSFVDVTTGDFHLNADSPCIDVATSTAEPTTDKDGTPRPQGNGWDMGAYEHHAATCRLAYVPADANGSIVGSATQVVPFFTSGTSVTASPMTGYHLVEWSDHSVANPRADSHVTSDATYTASFAINTYTLKYAPGTGGTLIGDTSQTVDYSTSGTSVQAVPDTANQYHFVNWSDGSTQNPRTDSSVTANVNVTANFGIYATVLLLDTGSNPSLGFGHAFSIGGGLRSGGAGLSGQKVILESKSTAAGASYQEISSQMTGAGGTFSFIQRPTNKTYYRVRFVAANGYAASTSDHWVFATPKAYLGTPIAPSTMVHSRYNTIYGWIKPRHAAGTYPVRIYKWRYVSGRWKSYGYTNAKAYNYSSYTKYSRSIRLPYVGKWRVRAYAPADNGHAATWSSGYDYVTVK